jgi:GH25 family lysozyme M1 (1,4-beta-N-acetylmuramidase)
MNHVNVLDISDFQDPCDMGAIKAAGFSGVYAKATEGNTYAAPTYASKRAAAKAAGLLFGAYHFMRWTVDGLAQALWFVSQAKPAPGDLLPMIDCEYPESGSTGLSAAQAVGLIASTAQNVTTHIGGKRPVLYMDPDFWATALASTDGFTGHPLWVAAYGAASPPALDQWKPALWQYTDALEVPGIAGPVDGDWFLGTRDEIDALRV